MNLTGYWEDEQKFIKEFENIKCYKENKLG